MECNEVVKVTGSTHCDICWVFTLNSHFLPVNTQKNCSFQVRYLQAHQWWVPCSYPYCNSRTGVCLWICAFVMLLVRQFRANWILTCFMGSAWPRLVHMCGFIFAGGLQRGKYRVGREASSRCKCVLFSTALGMKRYYKSPPFAVLYSCPRTFQCTEVFWIKSSRYVLLQARTPGLFSLLPCAREAKSGVKRSVEYVRRTYVSAFKKFIFTATVSLIDSKFSK